MDEIKVMLDGSGLDAATKYKLLTSAIEIAGKLALDQSKGQAGGDFLRLLIELIKMLLPILLELFKPKV